MRRGKLEALDGRSVYWSGRLRRRDLVAVRWVAASHVPGHSLGARFAGTPLYSPSERGRERVVLREGDGIGLLCNEYLMLDGRSVPQAAGFCRSDKGFDP